MWRARGSQPPARRGHLRGVPLRDAAPRLRAQRPSHLLHGALPAVRDRAACPYGGPQVASGSQAPAPTIPCAAFSAASSGSRTNELVRSRPSSGSRIATMSAATLCCVSRGAPRRGSRCGPRPHGRARAVPRRRGHGPLSRARRDAEPTGPRSCDPRAYFDGLVGQHASVHRRLLEVEPTSDGTRLRERSDRRARGLAASSPYQRRLDPVDPVGTLEEFHRVVETTFS